MYCHIWNRVLGFLVLTLMLYPGGCVLFVRIPIVIGLKTLLKQF